MTPTPPAARFTDCYIGRNPSCGCIRFWVSDRAENPKHSVMRAMTDGLHIERAVTEEAKAQSWECDTCEPARSQQDLFTERAHA